MSRHVTGLGIMISLLLFADRPWHAYIRELQSFVLLNGIPPCLLKAFRIFLKIAGSQVTLLEHGDTANGGELWGLWSQDIGRRLQLSFEVTELENHSGKGLLVGSLVLFFLTPQNDTQKHFLVVQALQVLKVSFPLKLLMMMVVFLI